MICFWSDIHGLQKILCTFPSYTYIIPFATNFSRITSPSNSSPGRFPSYRLLILLLYFLFIFYLPRCTLPDFPSVSSLASLPFLSCCQQQQICTMQSLPMPSLCFQSTPSYELSHKFIFGSSNRTFLLFFHSLCLPFPLHSDGFPSVSSLTSLPFSSFVIEKAIDRWTSILKVKWLSFDLHIPVMIGWK